MRSERADIPVHVNVVPGDQAAGRTGNAEVTTELSFQQAQRAKREASDALAAGDVDGARRTWDAASLGLRKLDLSTTAPPEIADEIAAEARVLEELAEQAETDQVLARKRALADHHMKSRQAGARWLMHRRPQAGSHVTAGFTRRSERACDARPARD